MASPVGHRRRGHPGRQLTGHGDQNQPFVAPGPAGPSSAGSTASTAASGASTTGLPAPARRARPRRPGCPGRADPRRRGRPAAPAPPPIPGPALRAAAPASRTSVIGSPARAAPTSTCPSAAAGSGSAPAGCQLSSASTGPPGRPRRTVAPAARSVAATRTGTLRADRWGEGEHQRRRGQQAGRQPAQQHHPTPARPRHGGGHAVAQPGGEAGLGHRSRVGRTPRWSPRRTRWAVDNLDLWTTRRNGRRVRGRFLLTGRPRGSGGGGRRRLVELDEEVLAELDPLSLPAFAAAAAAPEPLVSPPPLLFVAPSLAGVSPPVTVLPEPDRLSVR